MARTSTKTAARAIDAEYQSIRRSRGSLSETFTSPISGQVEENGVLISVRALNRLSDALRAEDTVKAMKRQLGGAS